MSEAQGQVLCCRNCPGGAHLWSQFWLVGKVALGSNWSSQAGMAKGVVDPQELFVISVRTGQIPGLGGEVRLPFFRPGVLEVVGSKLNVESSVALPRKGCM